MALPLPSRAAPHSPAPSQRRHLCDSGDTGDTGDTGLTGGPDGAIGLAVNVIWYWQMLGRHSDAVYWLGGALPLRALLRQYDGDLDGALADLTEAKRLAREFGSLSLSDENFIDLRWIDLQVRLGETARATEMIAATRDRALRSASPEMAMLLDARGRPVGRGRERGPGAW
ncbi:hypothetical protein [Streptomyces sp. 6N106]|uniref:hypothetical protein n=1 Tax=Streptomyces sp. 6N106 TaxID=3457418 RepID=UPI003FD09AF1